jgi:hypothetical protein
MRKAMCVMGLLLLVSLSAAAQDHSKADIFGGYSYLRVNPGNGVQGVNFNGGIGSVSINLNNWIGGVAEFGGYHNGSVYGSGVSANAISYLFGPKVYMSRGKITPFAQVLFGGAHVSASSTTANAFAMALGGGVDWNAGQHFAVRLGQVDYVMTRFNTGFAGANNNQNNFRFSTGIVFKF